MTYRRYTILTIALSTVLITLTAGLNILVDPYGIFGSPRFAGFNSNKPYAGDRGRIAKAHQVMRINPKTLIVGNSRPELGLDPEHHCWPDEDKPVFNYGIPGLTVYDQVRYTQHALASSQVSKILMGVDFVDFIGSGERQDASVWPADGESHLRLSVTATSEPRSQFAVDAFVDQFQASVSLNALADSLATIAKQRRQWVETRTELGFNSAKGIYVPIINTEGVDVLFTQKNSEMAKRLTPPQTLYNAGTDWSAQFEALDRLSQQAQQDGIELVLFINPYHAEYLLLLDAVGLWSEFEQWKKTLVQIAAKYNMPIWDFSVFDRHATESIADLPSRKQSLRWFWEPAHYREELGSRMLAKMHSKSCDTDDVVSFGVLLTEDNVQKTLTDIRTRRDTYIAANPAVKERLRMLVTSVVTEREAHSE